MKIVIPVDRDKSSVCVAFGRTPLFAVKDTEKGSVTYLDNPAAEAQGGAGIKAAQFVLDIGANAIVTVRLGENSAQVLKAAGVIIYKSEGVGADFNFTMCEEGKLTELTAFHAGYHGRQ